MKPSFAGSTVDEFKKHMSMVFSNMISVATNWQGGDDRTCLSGYIPTQEAAGYLIAVRESEETPTEILEMAQKLHQKIQEFYAG